MFFDILDKKVIMKRIFSAFIKRPLQNFNIENRAQKVIDINQVKPQPAPKHPSTLKNLENFKNEHPELLEEQKRKDPELLSRLQGMVVNPDKVGEIQSRPLPTDKSKLQDTDFGYFEPENIPVGKCTLKQAISFITDYGAKPTEYTADRIAKEFDLDSGDVEKVLKHFHAFQIQIPKDPTQFGLESGQQATHRDAKNQIESGK